MIINYENQNYECDDNLSFKDFTNVLLVNSEIEPGSMIYNSCFSKETPDTRVFSDDIIGITFINCNLDNVHIPAGNIIIGGSQRRFKYQSDGNDWKVDEYNLPIEPLNIDYFISNNLPVPTPEDLD